MTAEEEFKKFKISYEKAKEDARIIADGATKIKKLKKKIARI